MLSLNKVIYVEYIFCYRDYVCQVSKPSHMYVIGAMLLTKSKVLKSTQQFKSMTSLTDLCFIKKKLSRRKKVYIK